MSALILPPRDTSSVVTKLRHRQLNISLHKPSYVPRYAQREKKQRQKKLTTSIFFLIIIIIILLFLLFSVVFFHSNEVEPVVPVTFHEIG